MTVMAWTVLVVSILGIGFCVYMAAWGLGRISDAMVANVIETQTDRLLEANVPQPVIECVRTGQPIEIAGVADIDPNQEEMARNAVAQIGSVRLDATVATRHARKNSLFAAMACLGTGLVGLFVVGRSGSRATTTL